MDHNRYPLRMAHPNYWPGSIGKEVTGPAGIKSYEGGLPARFPPVIVHTEDQEEEHVSKGYVPSGKSDPLAFAAALAHTAAGYEPEQYPKWVNGKTPETPEEEARILAGQPKPVEEE